METVTTREKRETQSLSEYTTVLYPYHSFNTIYNYTKHVRFFIHKGIIVSGKFLQATEKGRRLENGKNEAVTSLPVLPLALKLLMKLLFGSFIGFFLPNVSSKSNL